MPNPVAVVAADIHLHPFKEGNEPSESGYGTRVDLTMAAIKEMYAVAHSIGADVWILGDLLHHKHHVPVQCVKPMLDLFAEYGRDVHTTLLVGNHERPDHVSPCTSLDCFTWLDNVKMIDQPTYDNMNHPFDVAWLPWFGDWEAPLTNLNEQLMKWHSPDRARILLGHGAVDGAVTPNGMRLANPNLKPEGFHLASYNLSLWGDIHNHQSIAQNAFYVGALCPQNYGERDLESGFIILYDDLTWERRTINSGPKFAYSDTIDTAAAQAASPTAFVRPSPEAVAAQVLQEESLGVAAPDLTKLDDLVRSYTAQFPIPEGFTDQDVLSALKDVLQ